MKKCFIAHPMLDYTLVHSVAAVVREGSFERAAQALSITPSALSQRVKLLEERLGAVLIVRGRPPRATAVGARLCRHAEQVALLERELALGLPDAAAPARLRVAVNADSLGSWFVHALARYAAADAVPVDVAVDDQDHTAGWLERGEVLAAVSASRAPLRGCRSLPLGRLRYVATASPAYVARHFARGVDARSLAQAPMLVYDDKDRLQHRFVERIARRAVHPPEHRLPSTQGFVDAALGGLGWGMNPLPLVREHLAAGRLVELVPRRPVDVALHWQVARLALPPLERLTDAVLATARERLA